MGHTNMFSLTDPSKVDLLLAKVVAAYDRLNTSGKKLHLYFSDIVAITDMAKLDIFNRTRGNTTVTYLKPSEDSVDPEA